MNKNITVTKPLLPPLDDFIPLLQDIWQRQWITNGGHYHEDLEKALCHYLKVPYITLFTNGTLPLMIALQALDLARLNRKGEPCEIITTPYSFVATSNIILWCGAIPVFVDVDETTGNIDPDKIEQAVTKNTRAIIPVHVYGQPCKTLKIQAIAQKYHLKVIYDAAHAFGVEQDGESILNAGDLSTLSFHATKVYNTVEGGALISPTAEMKKKIDNLKDFGITSETEVVLPGLNGKMDEIRAAYGLLNLKQVDKAINRRKSIAESYRRALKNVPGIRCIQDFPGIRYNYSYFPIFIDEVQYGISRDALYSALKKYDIYSRRYFYPLISDFAPYRDFPSANPENLPVASKIASSVLCLPIYTGLTSVDVQEIIEHIKNRGK